MRLLSIILTISGMASAVLALGLLLAGLLGLVPYSLMLAGTLLIVAAITGAASMTR